MSPTEPASTSTPADRRSGSPKEERNAQASGNAAVPPCQPGPPSPLGESEQARADLLDLAESAATLADRAKQLGLRRTARETARWASQLRASRTRVLAQPAHLPAAQAYIEAAADLLATVAARIGAAHRGATS